MHRQRLDVILTNLTRLRLRLRRHIRSHDAVLTFDRVDFQLQAFGVRLAAVRRQHEVTILCTNDTHY